MLNNSIPWPRKGDHLFKADEDWWYNAYLDYYIKSKRALYAQGYKLAGDLLVEHVGKTQSDQDFLVYPIVFLYRQYIELTLKELIRDGNKLLDIPEQVPKHHNINELWKRCRGILEKVWPEGPAEDLDAVEECIQQFSEEDPKSTAFRYPADIDGNPSLFGRRYVNLRNLAEVIARLGSFLNGSSSGISEYLGCKE